MSRWNAVCTKASSLIRPLRKRRPARANTLNLLFKLTDGVHSGRRLWERLNVSNPNKTAEDIARSQLAMLCQAVGVTKLTQTEDLHDKPFLMQVDIDRKDTTRNRIMGYQAAGGKASAPATPAPKSNGSSARPWAKG
jgi:hypothetical protein